MAEHSPTTTVIERIGAKQVFNALLIIIIIVTIIIIIQVCTPDALPCHIHLLVCL